MDDDKDSSEDFIGNSAVDRLAATLVLVLLGIPLGNALLATYLIFSATGSWAEFVLRVAFSSVIFSALVFLCLLWIRAFFMPSWSLRLLRWARDSIWHALYIFLFCFGLLGFFALFL